MCCLLSRQYSQYKIHNYHPNIGLILWLYSFKIRKPHLQLYYIREILKSILLRYNHNRESIANVLPSISLTLLFSLHQLDLTAQGMINFSHHVFLKKFLQLYLLLKSSEPANQSARSNVIFNGVSIYVF